MFENSTSAIKIFCGLRFSTWHSLETHNHPTIHLFTVWLQQPNSDRSHEEYGGHVVKECRDDAREEDEHREERPDLAFGNLVSLETTDTVRRIEYLLHYDTCMYAYRLQVEYKAMPIRWITDRHAERKTVTVGWFSLVIGPPISL